MSNRKFIAAMRRNIIIVAAVVVSAGVIRAEIETPAESVAGTPVEVVFVLDTTGSMRGLIAGAKEKIWYIAGNIARQNQGAPIKMGLLPYRDRGDEYITQRYDLTEDLDTMYSHLMSFVANGGGDLPESVNQALHEAVTMFSWSDDPATLRVIFLVGDAPPHMDYDDDVHYPLSCEAARERNIIINTVQCGTIAETTPFWKKIAALGEGEYAAISQSGGMRSVATPYDREIAEVSFKLDGTVIPFGSRETQEKLGKNIGVARAASLSVQADRQFANVMSKGRVVQGNADLLQEIVEGNKKLGDVPEKDLPDNMVKMDAAEREAHVEKMKS
ncbi:MAG: VWA domain-containing protein, partial [Kiritimatiellaeota bacterium]|nr:VWA domain-containing protein [Kiritimatiellota bacterium]